MLSPRDPQVRAFLGDSMIVQLATLSPKRRPFVTPLWFVVHGGCVYLTTGAETWAGKNVAERPAVTLLFRSEPSSRMAQVLRVRGTATRNRGLPPWPVLLRIAAKYYLGRGLGVELRNAGRWRLRQRYYGQAKGGLGYILVVPETCEFLNTPPAAAWDRNSA